MADPEELVPPLRSDLTWEDGPEGTDTFRMVDPALGRRLKVDRRGRDIALLLDRPQSRTALLARIEATGRPMAPDSLDRVLDAFEGLGLLDTEAADRTTADYARVQEDWRNDPGSTPLLVPPDLRFTCTACGSCCCGANIGPVEDEVVARLQARPAGDYARSLEGRRGLFFAMIPDGSSEEIFLCRSRNGACIFLEPGGLCAVHRAEGMEAKPRVCRIFPLQFMLTPRGVAVGLQMECRGILDAVRGQLLSEQVDDLRATLAIALDIPSVRMRMSLDGVSTLTYETYEALEDRVCEAAGGADVGGFDRMLLALGVVRAACAEAGTPFPAEASDPKDLRVDFYSFLQDLGEDLIALKRKHVDEGADIKFHTANMDAVVEAVSDLPLFADLVLASEETGDSRHLSQIAVLNFWRSKDVLLPSDLVLSTALSNLRWLLARAVAFSRARQVHRRAPDARDLVDGWVIVHMLLRNKQVIKALNRHHETIRTLFAHRLPELVEMRDRLVDVDSRTEFYLF